MKIEEYLAITEELANPETDVARRTELLTLLNEDYKTVLDETANLAQQQEKNAQQINDLTHAHALMFRKLGMLQTQTDEEVKQKTFSQSVNLNYIEGGQ